MPVLKANFVFSTLERDLKTAQSIRRATEELNMTIDYQESFKRW
jgi:hypothetical protein